jgi:hypothetical protein
MEKVVPFFKPFTTICYFKIFLDWIKFEFIWNKFKRVWINLPGLKPGHCCCPPPVSLPAYLPCLPGHRPSPVSTAPAQLQTVEPRSTPLHVLAPPLPLFPSLLRFMLPRAPPSLASLFHTSRLSHQSRAPPPQPPFLVIDWSNLPPVSSAVLCCLSITRPSKHRSGTAAAGVHPLGPRRPSGWWDPLCCSPSQPSCCTTPR